MINLTIAIIEIEHFGGIAMDAVKEGKRVLVHQLEQSEPIEIKDVRNTYQKGDLFCVLKHDGVVDKFPLRSIFRIREFPNSEAAAK